MNLLAFIRAEVDSIVDEWESFAKTCLPAAKDLDSESLRDHAKVMLLTFADDMELLQSAADKNSKSTGDLQENSPLLTKAGGDHALERFEQGFTLGQMVSEYRALRASVVRRWTAQQGEADSTALDELVRFGEAVDQAIAESVVVHMDLVEGSRNVLLGVLGHDLRNPLGAVRMSAEYLLRTDGLSGQQTLAVARIANSATTMKKMVEDLLDFTHTMLVRTLPLKIQAGNLGEICSEVVDELVAFHPGRAIHFSREGDLSGLWDSVRIWQLLSNVAGNAIHHGEAQAAVKISLRGELDSVVVEVHNEGTPIPESARAALFKPPVATSVVRNAVPDGSSGLGLGLYIAHEIVAAHKGLMEMESTESAGTTFRIRLPRSVRPDSFA